MIRGTTPTHIFNLPIQTNSIKEVRVSYKQGDTILVEKTEHDVKMTSTAIKLTLSQEDTLKFAANIPVQVQLKVLTTGDVVLATPVRMVQVSVILNEEVLG